MAHLSNLGASYDTFYWRQHSGCQLRLVVSPFLIDGSVDNVQREVGSLKGKLQTITKILKKISKERICITNKL